ncbi:hypothetical protein M406DRAFT_324265 [Cryphonectria parasitica EP155]|uniref:alpha-galactosidase n=1 Tax=Cryphonectria parasitica (strain ATCC 38755 / EP155) TaxID=660469 RepID=A0A9P5CL55_CRYP1|nr:uncharacterized protein M406DRAFT_324265 [Cryphonectria parasitica EP155]KAF3761882.1 hypothetical protein M406DRAFT_324265 [Cryphonectria parasitica EP155]
MSAPSAKFEVMDDGGRHRARHSKRCIVISALVAAVVVLALALGLGLGLGLHRGGSGGSGSSGSSSSCTDTGNCTTGPANSSVPVFASDHVAWQIVLSQTLTLDNETKDDATLVTPNQTTSPNVTVFDIDMFLHQNLSVVQDLRAQGMHVICYFSSGSYEPYRPDSWKFHSDDLGNELDGWPGEYWLDLNSNNVRNIMISRIEIAAQMNCSGIDPDNVDGYDNDNGLGLTEDDSINFVQFLANEAASRGMMTGLKNAGGIIDDVLDYVQFSVNEQCVEYDECDMFQAFPNASKPVFHIEYPAGDDDTAKASFDTSTVSQYCDVDLTSGQNGFNTVLKYMNLSGWVQYCDDKTFTTDGF